MSRATEFSHAIVRTPALSAVDGLRATDSGDPDADLLRQHHYAYVSALRGAGAEVIVLPPLEAFPDSCFVEDPVLCLPEGAVLLNPGAESRRGEVDAIAPSIRALYGEVHCIRDGHVEGGDILVTDHEILIGRSARTDARGVAALREIVGGWGYSLRELSTPPEVLHFKTDCGLLDGGTVLSTARLAESGCFEGLDVILTGEGEEACANCVRFNDVVLFPLGFARTADILRARDYDLVELPNSEAARIDGGMSCLSLRFTPGGANRSEGREC